MKDIQNQRDERNIPLQLVGIKKLVLPIFVENKKNQPVRVSATVNCYTDLSSHQRGTHMSRPAEILHTHIAAPLTFVQRQKIANRIKQSLHANFALLDITFTYHIKKPSPISKMESYMSYDCKIQTIANDIKSSQQTTVRVPVLLLCPCSKAISKHNAHNQRAIISIEVKTINTVFLEDLIKIAEESASSPVYSILKRPDEKYVTEHSYDHPKFVEDTVRDITLKLRKLKNVTAFTVECESQESIHGHNAYARYSQGGLQ